MKRTRRPGRRQHESVSAELRIGPSSEILWSLVQQTARFVAHRARCGQQSHRGGLVRQVASLKQVPHVLSFTPTPTFLPSPHNCNVTMFLLQGPTRRTLGSGVCVVPRYSWLIGPPSVRGGKTPTQKSGKFTSW
ncbi:hypothetical protein BaRGS_00021195 [Batillaria attramentaria]|uniref:Uncharacterized protein n=1 Tax=Batillaria attramentaria TaxID=370345 RepID=A0ABD0KJV3_9CAEN